MLQKFKTTVIFAVHKKGGGLVLKYDKCEVAAV